MAAPPLPPTGCGGQGQKRESEREWGRSGFPVSAPESRRKWGTCHGGVIAPYNYSKFRDNSTGGELLWEEE